ncbi:unnamed protein product [Adineta ricciae]|uniref:Calcipressin-like protein n=1 Tax=Adineta ricciae TaxID=249248 RepID=A0A814ASI0_ADIRI|nr:unnamed protein product [Adineta ricciae]CAF0919075.1 unnamed protein product [Adineta ricciae]
MLSPLPSNGHDDNTPVNPKSYYINYVDDPSDESERKSFDLINSSKPEFVFEGSSCQLVVKELPKETFTDENIQCEFECIFHEFDPEVIISYSTDFQRAYLMFSDPMIASQVCTHMNGKEFYHRKLSISFKYSPSSSIEYLKPPEQEQIYMQSPPTTPPIGWVTKREELPEINFDLFLALSKLQSNEPLEILPQQNHLPAIVIHPCSDTSDEDEDDGNNSMIDEFGQQKYINMDAKRRAHILHNAILVPGEKHIRQSIGDGDNRIP